VFDISVCKVVDDIEMLFFTKFVRRHTRPCVMRHEEFHVFDGMAVRKDKSIVVCCQPRLKICISIDQSLERLTYDNCSCLACS